MNSKAVLKKRKLHPLIHEALWSMTAVILSVCAGVVLMYGAYKMPLVPIQQHVRESLPCFPEDHPSYDYWAPWDHSTRLDLSTDATMLREAVYNSGMGALKSSMLNIMPYYIPDEATKKLREGSSVDPQNPSAVDLEEYLRPEAEQDPTLGEYASVYGRYWHGYLVFLKPMLVKMNLQEIRMVNVVVLSLLTAWAVYEISRKGNWIALSAFLLGLAVINPVTAAMSMQYMNSCVLMLIGVALTFRLELWNRKDSWKMFLFMGILSAFFDFLTYPLVTLGIPLLFCVFMNLTQSLSKSAAKTLNSCIVWAFGYGGMWAGKWIAGSLISGENLIASGLNRAAMRTNGGSQIAEQVSLLETLDLNWNVAFSNVIKLTLVIIVVGTICWLLRKKVKPVRNNMFWLLAVISLFPFAWYFVLNNHSWHHFWLTYRILAVTITGWYLALFCFFQKSMLKRREQDLLTLLSQTRMVLNHLQPSSDGSADTDFPGEQDIESSEGYSDDHTDSYVS